MAEVKNKPRKTASGGRSGSAAAKKEEAARQQTHRRQIWALLLFALGVLIAAITFIEGQNIWSGLHRSVFGLFGWCGYLIAPFILYIAIMLSLEKIKTPPATRIIQVVLLLALTCAATQVFSPEPEAAETFWQRISALYDAGVEFGGGGVFSLIFAWPLTALLGRTPAAITICVLLFVVLMLLTGTTIADLIRRMSGPVKKIEESYTQLVENRKRHVEIDIPVDDPPVQASAREYSGRDPEQERFDQAKAVLTGSSDEPDPQPIPIPPEPELFAEPTDEEIQLEISSLVQRAVHSTKKPPLHPDGRFHLQDELPPEPAPPPEPPAYRYPPVELLSEADNPSEGDISDELKDNAETLVNTLKSFNVPTRVTAITRGPTVTRYELQPSAGVKISRITGLADDIALNLASAGVRIEAPIPNKAAVGIEVPNKIRNSVTLRELVESDTFQSASSKLTVAVGLDIAGSIVTADIAKMPHALIAGSTGAGKSVCINTFIVSLLYKSSPSDVRLIMIDPKMVEFKKYDGIPHLLVPVVTDPRKAAGALGWAVNEMLNRYKLFSETGANDIRSYNKLAETDSELDRLPQIVIIIDELSDLMMAAPNEVEDAICRLAQMARAAGMHLLIATQRPSVNVITGVIKANIPTRIALMLSSQVDSRTILDAGGAEKLLGNGDMLFHPAGIPKPIRVQGCWVDDEDIKKVIAFIKEGQDARYDEQVIDEIEHCAVLEKDSAKNGGSGGGFEEDDPMLHAAIECVIELGQASTSMLQRKLKLGYARAARLVDEMEERGIIGPYEGSKPRPILITRQQWIEMKMNGSE